MRTAKNLARFAKRAGVSLVDCDAAEWGGAVGYREKDHPDTVIAGFRTERAAYNHWLESTFGKHTAAAVKSLLRGRA